MLKKLFISFYCFFLLPLSVLADNNPRVLLSTNMGEIVIELDQQKAPISVANFLSYVDSRFYNGTIFHRVIADFMIQGGGYTANMTQKSTLPPIQNEATNGLTNDRGTIAMARTNDINSATSQFFINLKNNDFLNHTENNYGYAVFGKVIQGMDVVDNIGQTRTTFRAGARDVPSQDVIITSAKRLK